jgi:ABC-type ATPase involved in cell division
VPRAPAADQTVIATEQLSKMYSRGVYALRDVTLTIGKGEFVFLTGPSGAGKSTLLRLLLRQELPTSGRLVVNGRTLGKMSASEVQRYRRTVGFVFQDFKLIASKSVFENITFVPRVLGLPRTCSGARRFQVLKWVGLQHRMNALSPRALRRRTAARRDRARAAERPRADPRRRADGQPRSRPRTRHHESLPRDQRAGHDGAGGHARPRADPPRGEAHDRARARHRGGGRVSLVRFSWDEAVGSLWRNRRSSLLAVLTIAVALFVLGVFAVAWVNVQRVLTQLQETAEASVYLADDVSESQRAAVDAALAASSEVREHRFVSRDEALRRFTAAFPDLAHGATETGDHPLPASFDVRLQPAVGRDAAALETFAAQAAAGARRERRALRPALAGSRPCPREHRAVPSRCCSRSCWRSAPR